jgi:hypothetical protein
MTQILEHGVGATLSLIDETLGEADRLNAIPGDALAADALGDVAPAEYSYTVAYDGRGAISGAVSESFDPDTSTRTSLTFDKNGEESGRSTHTVMPGFESHTENGVTRFMRIVEDAGAIATSRWFDAKGELTKATIVNRNDNTLTMQFVQNGTYGPVEIVTPYAGAEGWVSAAPQNIEYETKKKK